MLLLLLAKEGQDILLIWQDSNIGDHAVFRKIPLQGRLSCSNRDTIRGMCHGRRNRVASIVSCSVSVRTRLPSRSTNSGVSRRSSG